MPGNTLIQYDLISRSNVVISITNCCTSLLRYLFTVKLQKNITYHYLHCKSKKDQRHFSLITLSNIGRFLKFFQRWIQQEIFNKISLVFFDSQCIGEWREKTTEWTTAMHVITLQNSVKHHVSEWETFHAINVITYWMNSEKCRTRCDSLTRGMNMRSSRPGSRTAHHTIVVISAFVN